MRAAHGATTRRGGARFRHARPPGAETSPSGNRTERANLRVETLISIWFMAHLPIQSSATAAPRSHSEYAIVQISSESSRNVGKDDEVAVPQDMGAPVNPNTPKLE
jgi:hypothetical protein